MEHKKSIIASPVTKAQKGVELVIFNVRWLLIPFYLGLVAILGLYYFTFQHELIRTFHEARNMTPSSFLLALLEAADIVMVANLLVMIISGSYNSFVSKAHGYVNANISSGMLKIKMSTSLVLVTSIHLLQTFLNSENVGWDDLKKQLVIHATFLLGSLILSVSEFLHEYFDHKTHSNKKAIENEN